jgi:hypothetical protein
LVDQTNSDEEAAVALVRLLELQNPLILLTGDGPKLWALLMRFGLVQPFLGQEKLDSLEPELACSVLVEFEKWKILAVRQDQAKEVFISAAGNYQVSS